MAYDNKKRVDMVQEFVEKARNGGGDPNAATPEDQFINNANSVESVIPAVGDDDARFLQNSMNMFDGIMSQKQGTVSPNPLKIDGDFGPKSQGRFKEIYASLPPHIRKVLQKKMNGGDV